MNHVHVLAGSNGPLKARVMFIGEAPGRLGAARTGVPFTSDQSGLRFQRLLAAAGLRREEVFLTNALLCNPLRNSRPAAAFPSCACARWLTRLACRPAARRHLGRHRWARRTIERHFASRGRRQGPWRGHTLCRSTTLRRGRRAGGRSHASWRTSAACAS
jgi:uracil-DNA glycosylase family 4